MKAFYYDELPGDQRLMHDSGQAVSQQTLSDLGVLYHKIPIDAEGAWKQSIDKFAQTRGYKNRDQINVTPRGLGESYEAKIKMFFDEHLHDDEEIRYILDGSGFFDVRGKLSLAYSADDWWSSYGRQEVDPDPPRAGIYHRFTVDEGNDITAMRLFQDEPKWTPYSRAEDGTDTRESRHEYVRLLL
ncbi:hypothetical protein CspHIS471_0603680 [Cutaneotrichosporon sp. HIS471]|nr:hypothetical protein CspHIS471_0603680 [Cutaneotrichosporon sp. HIS471]